MSKITAEYIWVDGSKPTAQLRSKTMVLDRSVWKNVDTGNPLLNVEEIKPCNVPEWTFDGSSTNQASTDNSDLILKPVETAIDPHKKNNSILVLCEVMNADGTPHESNHRAKLVELSEQYKHQECLFGIEQEYCVSALFDVHGDDDDSIYCSVGRRNGEVNYDFARYHLSDCLDAGLSMSGINREVLSCQFEYQIGAVNALAVSDHLWIARWLMLLRGEESQVHVSLDPKPAGDDQAGSGAHVNFSTIGMREGTNKYHGIELIDEAIGKLKSKHTEHIAVYGHDNAKRLTGSNETQHIDKFTHGVGDRTASIRIPAHVAKAGKGYLEDRRPGANIDPYVVCAKMIETICGGE